MYTFGPVFRADNAVDRTHLAEFYMLEAELTASDLTELMDLIEELVKSVAVQVLDNAGADIHQLRSGSIRYVRLPASSKQTHHNMRFSFF